MKTLLYIIFSLCASQSINSNENPQINNSVENNSSDTIIMIVDKDKVKDEYLNQENPEAVFTEVEEMPEFPGGQRELFHFLASNIRYPQKALANDIQGRVIVNFVVDKEGNIKDAKVEKSVNADLDAEALRLVNLMPKWKPGKNNGKAVNCYFNLPITFKVSSK